MDAEGYYNHPHISIRKSHFVSKKYFKFSHWGHTPLPQVTGMIENAKLHHRECKFASLQDHIHH
jgi:hypothetical protein